MGAATIRKMSPVWMVAPPMEKGPPSICGKASLDFASG
ncbi:hypothetical protein STENM223S_08474 [Streptomyces tendae]